MSNTSKGLGVKGSKLMMQLLVNNQPEILNKALGITKIKWISPLKEEYKEYRLEEQEIQQILNIHSEELSFWPANGPQWDGIAVAEEGTESESLLLFEAKAHTSEAESKCSAKKDESKKKIRQAIGNIFSGPIDKWLDKYYQVANRYVFLSELSRKRNVKLVFVYFANDSFGKTSVDEWKKCNESLEKEIKSALINKTLEESVHRIVLDVKTEFEWKNLK